MAHFIDVWINCPDRETAERIGAACIEERLAACANILAPIVSIYRWKDKVERTQEAPLVLKTRAELFDALSERVKISHPYEAPSIVATDLPHVDAGYADWLRQETREPV